MNLSKLTQGGALAALFTHDSIGEGGLLDGDPIGLGIMVAVAAVLTFTNSAGQRTGVAGFLRRVADRLDRTAEEGDPE